MEIERRMFLAGSAALSAVGSAASAVGVNDRYGLISKITAQAGKRQALASILTMSASNMPGCLSYVVADDTVDAEAIWITEVWASKEAHAASLGFSSVRDAIQKARPLLAGLHRVAETVPIGGSG